MHFAEYTRIKLLVIILVSIQLAGYSQDEIKFSTNNTQLTFNQLLDSLNQLEQDSLYKKAQALLNLNEKCFQDKWFELSKEKIYLNEKLGNFHENFSVFTSGHEKGYFYLIHPNLPKYKPYLELAGFDSIAKIDLQLRREAITNSKTLFEVELPLNYNSENDYPLILIFHGGGSNFSKVKKHWNSEKLTNEFIKIYLQSYRHYDSDTYGWSSGDARTYSDIIAILNELKPKYPIDTSRIIVAGISAGGTCAIDLAINQIIPITGFLTFCPGIPKAYTDDFIIPTPELNIAGYIVGGEDDYYLSKQLQLVELLIKATIKNKHTTIPGMGHQYPLNEEKYITEGIEFLLQNSEQ
jgi:predicted esterase